MTEEQVPVLIVGAGGAGLSLSLLLLQQGIRPLLVERRAEVSIYPRARNLNFRTLEVLRGLGLGTEVHAAGARLSQEIFKESLAAKEEEIIDPATLPGVFEGLNADVTPEPFAWHCPQSRLEPILCVAARQRGADIGYGTELVSFTQDDAGVTANLVERATSQSKVVRADYLAACDGAHSHIRQTLGVPTSGYGVLPEHFIFIYFRAPWQALVAGHESDGFMINNRDVRGVFMVAKDDLGMFAITCRPAAGEPLADFTAEHCRDLVQKGIGVAGMPVEIVEVARWQSAEAVAAQLAQGRVFLVGDAAHTMPAYKGLGVNTAIQSAQNLAWKLSAVLRGHAPPELLTTYQAERHPVGRFAAHQSLTGPGADWLIKGQANRQTPESKDLPMFYPIVGYRYRSAAIVSDDAASPLPRDEIALLDRQELTGVPGTRVPHVWLQRGSQRISTLDLIDGRFVLLTGSDGTPWCNAAALVAASLGIALAVYRIGPDADLLDLEQDWPARTGISSDGAVLVRPDGFVGWRCSRLTNAPDTTLKQALDHILCRTTSRRLASSPDS